MLAETFLHLQILVKVRCTWTFCDIGQISAEFSPSFTRNLVLIFCSVCSLIYIWTQIASGFNNMCAKNYASSRISLAHTRGEPGYFKSVERRRLTLSHLFADTLNGLLQAGLVHLLKCFKGVQTPNLESELI